MISKGAYVQIAITLFVGGPVSRMTVKTVSKMPDDIAAKMRAHIDAFMPEGVSYINGGPVPFKSCRACWHIHPSHAPWCTIKFLEELLKEHE
jgi:hypothetical protein